MSEFLTALGLVLILEGLVYGALPALGRKLGEFLLTTPEEVLRLIGLGSAGAGLVIIWLVRG